jgi:hypothetical protein
MAQSDSSIARWGIATRPRKGETDSGDLHLVAELRGGLLMGVVDGAGHGPDAAAAARLAIRTLSGAPAGIALTDLVNDCHEQLRGSRGGVMSLGLIREQDRGLSWLGIGNVTGVLYSDSREAPARLLLRSGVVGMWLPALKPHTLELVCGDTVIFSTDGIDTRFIDELGVLGDPQALADRILRDYGNPNDDALVLVLRYTGKNR